MSAGGGDHGDRGRERAVEVDAADPGPGRLSAAALSLVGIVGILGVASAGCGDDLAADPLGPDAGDGCPMTVTTPGIDVSKYQGAIDWPAVAGDGIAFAFVRVSDGITDPDPSFDDNWAGAAAAGVVRGAYQFFRPRRDPVAQADLLLARMGPLIAGDLPPAIDVEVSDGVDAAALAAAVGAWLDRIQAVTGRRGIVYTGPSFWADAAASAELGDPPLWVAHWGRDCPTVPAPWRAWTFWQTGATGRVAGIVGDVDTDLFHGDLDALRAFATGP